MSIENKKTFEDLEMIMRSSAGDVVVYKYHPMFDDLLITCGIKYFADEAEAHWLCDIVFSNITQIHIWMLLNVFQKITIKELVRTPWN